MFIECGSQGCSPPSGGSCLSSRTHCTLLGLRHGPPDGGRACAPVKSINIALLTEGGLCSGEINKHGSPDGGRLVLR
jgi:hypothetical protein